MTDLPVMCTVSSLPVRCTVNHTSSGWGLAGRTGHPENDERVRVMTTEAFDDTAESSLHSQRQNIRKSLKGFHSIFFILAGMIALETLGQVSSFGAETLTWIIIIAVLFVVPYGLIVSELGSTYPYEGGPYPWMRRAWGKTVAGLGVVIYWVATPVWVGGSLCFAAAAAFSSFFVEMRPGSLTDWAFKLTFIVATVSIAIVSLRKAKWIPTIGAIIRIGALLVFSLSLVLYAFQHGLHGASLHDFSPSLATLFGLAPILLFSFQGFELPSTAAEEMANPERDVPRAVGVATIIVALAYAIPVLGIVMVLPADSITGISGFLDAIAATFSVFGPAAGILTKFAAGGFIVGLLTTGGSWLMGVDRTYAVAALDGSAPRFLGKFSPRFGTPVRVNVISGALAIMLLIAAQFLTSGSSSKSFALVLYLATSAGIMSYLVVLSSALRLRVLDPDRRRPYRVPGGVKGLTVATCACMFWLALGTWSGLFPGTLESLFGIPYSVEDVFGVGRMHFELFTLGTLAVMVAIAVMSVWFSRTQSLAPEHHAAPPNPVAASNDDH